MLNLTYIIYRVWYIFESWKNVIENLSKAFDILAGFVNNFFIDIIIDIIENISTILYSFIKEVMDGVRKIGVI